MSNGNLFRVQFFDQRPKVDEVTLGGLTKTLKNFRCSADEIKSAFVGIQENCASIQWCDAEYAHYYVYCGF